MNKTICQLLEGKADNHMLPFFWQHGEEKAVLRKYMEIMDAANCHAVCVESRPHPDFAGEQWWHDMDIILEEARNRNMKVWILDDSHFPTGYANGALKKLPATMRKQNVYFHQLELTGEAEALKLDLRQAGLMDLPTTYTVQTDFWADDDTVLFAVARNSQGQVLDLTGLVEGETLCWDKPAGDWTLQVGFWSRNMGGRRENICIIEEEGVQVLIDAVYEPHWQHYAADFGKTIQGFFSDEPELGNGRTYANGNRLGTDQDLPWSPKLEAMLVERLGENWRTLMPLLWTEGEEAPKVRSIYMDCVSRRVREAFSNKLGDWCQAHGVRYIGHLIEDEGQHCRTGSTLGHYFRGLQGQHMSGIDNIGGQVVPYAENDTRGYFRSDDERAAEFYHYALAKLAQSAAAIEPKKEGNAMCEIFGNYGWVEGVRMEKYIADHYLVRGVNQYVPHAFSPKAYPDIDCPPHFYAHGHHPQYRHFGEICGYMNRVATLTSSGKHEVPVAVLYHGESEWADSNAMPFEKPLRALYDVQIDCHVIPADVFVEQEYYQTRMGNPLVINGQTYRAFVVPETKALPASAVRGLCELAECGLPVYFVNKLPVQVAETGEALPDVLKALPVVALSQLAEAVEKLNLATPKVEPANYNIRILHINGDTPAYFIVNENPYDYSGAVTLPTEGNCYLYDPWDNVCRAAEAEAVPGGTRVKLAMEPLKTFAVVFGDCNAPLVPPVAGTGEAVELNCWNRSICPGIEYPNFGAKVSVSLPDDISGEQPLFSGFLRYETVVTGRASVLEITDAAEGVEVFVNGRSLGIQIAPPFRYDLSGAMTEDENRIAIEVATTLERQSYPMLDENGRKAAKPPVSKSGLTGAVRLYK